MPRLLTLSRAARLVGIRRGALQSRIRSGEPGDAAGLLAWLQQRLEPVAQVGQPLLEQESFLRIMTAHVQVKPSGREFFVDGSDSLLEAALRAGLSLDYGCSIGSCGKCKARVVSGQVHRTHHSDYALTAAEKNAGVVLMCCNTALTDLVIEAREAHGAADMPLQTIDARVKSVSPLGDNVRLLHLQTPRTNRLRFLAGQSASLSLAGGISASLPVASCPCDDRNLQFHVRRRAGDAFGERVFGGLPGVESVRVEGPRGTFVLNEDSHRPLVFIAGESGFAPVKSLIEHAMALDTAETLHLCWITSDRHGRYLDNLCRSWSDALDNFRYTPLTAKDALSDEHVLQGLLQPLLQEQPRLADCDVYLAGPGPWASAAEFHLLDHGLPRAQLLVDTLES
jgi:CDP-4-dehydro-6-deoxyglucose reductase